MSSLLDGLIIALGRESRLGRMVVLLTQVMKFIGSGLIIFFLGLGISALMHEGFCRPEEASTAVAIAVLILVNFTIGRIFDFRSPAKIRHQLPRFAITGLVIRGAEYVGFRGSSLICLTSSP